MWHGVSSETNEHVLALELHESLIMFLNYGICIQTAAVQLIVVTVAQRTQFLSLELLKRL